ncbi:MAG: phage major capsid protein [Deltaproteobacteria bacterium]|nr:phage major capsid protein [Deltaproteobacteria bacterium]MBW2307494.1 phage major capsid protein [Deltaproteobacteria bacterium]
MALTGATLNNISNALKEFYLPAIREQLNTDTILLKRLARDEVNVSGKEAVILLHTGRNKGIGARADGGALPSAGYQHYTQAKVPMKYNYGRIELSGPTIKATRDDQGGWKRMVNAEIEGMVRDLRKDVNRQLWGCGYGILGRWRSTESATSYTLQKLYRGNSAGGDGFGSTFGAKYIEAGNTSMVAVVLTAGTSIAVGTTDMAPSAVSEGTAYDTITVTDPGVVEAAGTFYVRGDANGQAIGGTTAISRYEMMGLRGIVADTNIDDILTDGSGTGVTTDDTLQGIDCDDASGNTWWRANVVICGLPSGGTRYAQQNPLTLDDMQRAFDAAPEKLGIEYEPTLILMPFALRRKLVDLLTADKRYNTLQLDGGYTAIEFNGRPVVVDTDAVDGEIHFLYEPSLRIYRMSDFDWMDMDGAVLSRVSGYDAYEAILYAYMELGVDNRRANSVLADIDY